MFSVEDFVKWLETKKVNVLKAIKIANRLGSEYVQAVFNFYNININL